MPYQTNSVLSFAALKTEIDSFLTANGWTQEGDILKRNGVFAKITTGIHPEDGATFIQLEGGKGSDGAGNLVDKHESPSATTWSDNAGRMMSSVGVGSANGMVFPITYHFHLESSPVDEFWCFIEFNGDRSQHMGFGNIVKAGPFTGGGFYSSSVNSFDYSSGGDFYDFDANFFLGAGVAGVNTALELLPFNGCVFIPNHFSGSAVHAEIGGAEWFSSGYITNWYPAQERMISGFVDRQEREVSESTVNGMPNLVPLRLFGRSKNDNHQRIGALHNLRVCQIANMDFGQVETDGTDSWKFYPVYRKDTSDPDGGVDHTGTVGLAVRYDGP